MINDRVLTVKIRCYPSKEQKLEIKKTLGACRHIWNCFHIMSKDIWDEEKRILPYPEFARWVTWYKKQPGKEWVDQVSTKALKGTMRDFDRARRTRIKSRDGFLKTKKEKNPLRSYYFIKDGVRYVDEHPKRGFRKIWIPVLRTVKIREGGKLPDLDLLISGRVIQEKDGRYYIMLILFKEKTYQKPWCDGVGIDLGVSNYITLAIRDGNGGHFFYRYPSILDRPSYRKNEDRIKNLQRAISKKQEVYYQRKLNDYKKRHDGAEPSERYKNIMKGESYNACEKAVNTKRLRKKLNRCYSRRANMTRDYIKKTIHEIVTKIKPRFIAIENLDISEMLENIDTSHELHTKVAQSCFYYTKQFLFHKADQFHIPIRVVDQYYPSSKRCSECGHTKRKLKMTERMYQCKKCGMIMDRDENAARNICEMEKKYYMTVLPSEITILFI